MKMFLFTTVALALGTTAALAQAVPYEQPVPQPGTAYVTVEETVVINPGFPAYVAPKPEYYNDNGGNTADQYDWSYWKQDANGAPAR